MGQQQLLLLVLGMIVVGVAILVGIQTFGDNQKKANIDALQLTSLRIASKAQAWLRTPSSFGGGVSDYGNRSGDFTGLTLSIGDLGYEVDGTNTYTDLYGTYVGEVSSGRFIITAASASTSGGGDNNLICTIVSGPTVRDVTSVINPRGGTCG